MLLRVSNATSVRYTGNPRSATAKRRSETSARTSENSVRFWVLLLDSDDTPIYDQDPFARTMSQGSAIIFIGSTTQKGGQSGMTACSADSVIIGVYAREATAQDRPHGNAPKSLRLRWMHDPDPHPL